MTNWTGLKICHYLGGMSNSRLKGALQMCLALVFFYLSINNSELVFVIAGGIFGLYMLLMIYNKKWEQFGIGCLVGIIGLLSQKDILDIVLNPSKYASGQTSAASWTTRNILSADIVKIKTNSEWELNQFLNNLSGNNYLSILIISVVLLIIVINIMKYSVNDTTALR